MAMVVGTVMPAPILAGILKLARQPPTPPAPARLHSGAPFALRVHLPRIPRRHDRHRATLRPRHVEALGLFPAFGRWLTAMPGAILGALALMLFGLVGVSGLRLLRRAVSPRATASSSPSPSAGGPGAPSQAAWAKTLPGWIEALRESGIAAGGLTALVLNLILLERDWRSGGAAAIIPCPALGSSPTLLPLG